MITRKESQISAAEYKSSLKEEEKATMASVEAQLEGLKIKGEIANELPPGLCFGEIGVNAYFCPKVKAQVQKLEDAIAITKLFDLSPVAFVKSGCTEMLPKAEAEKAVQKDSYKIMGEISPVWGEIDGSSREREEVHVLFYSQLKTHLVRVEILLMDDRRIYRTWTTEQDHCCKYIVKKCMWHDETQTFAIGTAFYASETNPNPFKLWNPLKA